MAAIDDHRTLPPTVTGRTGALLAWFDPGEPRPYRGPFTRWPQVADATLALMVFFASLVAVAVSALGDGEDFTMSSIGDRPAGALALLAAAAAALWWRRGLPIAATGIVLAVMMVWALAGYGDGQDLALVIAMYSVGRYGTNRHYSFAAVAIAAAVSIIGTIVDTNQRVDIAPAIVVTALPWYIGRRIRNRGDYLALLQERAERLEADQHAEARQAVADERSRIARELHDVVAHRVSMMTVQAGAAKTIAPHDLDAAVEAMGDTERAGRQALGELRHLLGVLRPDTADPDHLGPQPGLKDVPALVDQLTHTGADVTLTNTDKPKHLAAAVDLSAYRIIQESITNIIKHAGPNPTVEISVAINDHHLVIDITNTTNTADITNTMNSASPHLPSSGFGIAGMGERATLLGGTFNAGPQPPNRYRVQASLPLTPGANMTAWDRRADR